MKIQDLPYQPEYFSRYFDLLDANVTLLEAIQKSVDELDTLPLQKYARLGSQVYAPGKWTINDIFQHIVDTTRIFTYRALAFARKDPNLPPSFNEDDYVIQAKAENRELADILQELKCVNQSFLALYSSFDRDMLLCEGMGFKGSYTVASIGFTIPGHQRWHMRIIEERYLPLIGA